jgi:predicted  nucleic acid-binding Zn-ribbon protein
LNRYKEETGIKMDQLKAEIENVKINEDKIMRSLQDLREQRKGSDTASEEGKQRPVAIEEDWIEDELRAAVKKGFEPS